MKRINVERGKKKKKKPRIFEVTQSSPFRDGENVLLIVLHENVR